MREEEREVYDFTLDEMKQFKDKKGIYGLVYIDGDKSEIIYIGQSKNLGSRLQSHRNENAFNNTLKQVFKEDGKSNRCRMLAMYHFINENREKMGFVILKETEKLNYWEEHYLTKFQPRYNIIGVKTPYQKYYKK